MAMDVLELQIQDNANQAVDGLSKLTNTLNMLKSATSNNAGLGKVARTLSDIATAASGINGTNLETFATQMTKVVSSLAPLQNLGKNNLTSFVTQLNKIPELTSSLNAMEIDGGFDSLAVSIQKVADAMKPLATEMEKISMGFSALPKRIQSFITQMDRSGKGATTAAKGYKAAANGLTLLNQKFNLSVLYAAMRRASNILGDFVENSNQYVEDINLFTVSMGEYADSAYNYAQKAQALMGIDAGQFMRNQGFFQSIASGFGVASDQASVLSQNLAQLGYDLASFYNADVETAMQKLQSGLAGELEPLRRWGFALDQITLQETARAHGIQMSIRDMNQAQKAQIRYIAIMEQSVNAQHDMARTLQTPANAMRVFNQQITLLGRSIGNILIPMLSAILPYAIAAAKVLRAAADALASLFGYTLPTIDYDNFGGLEVGAGAAEDIEDSIGGAAKEAKKMRDYVLGIDELNILRPDEDPVSGGSGAGASVGAGFEDLNLPTYDFLDGLTSKVDDLIPKMQALLAVLGLVAAGFAAYKLVNGIKSLVGWFGELGTVAQFFARLLGGVIGVLATFFGGFTLGAELAKLFAGELEGFTFNMGLGIAAIVAGTAVLTAMLGPAGLVLGVVTSLVGVMLGVASAQNEMQMATAVNTIFSPNGGAPVRAIADNFKELTVRVIETSNAMLVNKANMDALAGSIDLGSQKVYNLASANIETLDQAKDILPRLAKEYESLSNDIVKNIELAGDTINTALILLPQEAFDQAKTTLPETSAYVSSAVTGLSRDVLDLNAEFADLMARFNADPNEAGLVEKLQDVALNLVDLGGASVVMSEDYTSAISGLVPVDFSELLVADDANATLANMTALVDEIGDSGALAQAKLTEAYTEISKSMDVIVAGMSPEQAQQTRDTFAAAFELEYGKIVDAQSESIGLIMGGFEAALDAAAMNVDPIWIDHLLAWDHTAEEEASRRIKRQFSGVFESLDVAAESADVGKNILDGFVEGIKSGNTSTLESYSKKMAKMVPDSMKSELGINSPSKVTQELGKFAIEGLANGLTENTNVLSDATLETVTALVDTLKTELKISGSTSAATKEIGQYFDQGLVDGIKNKLNDVKLASKSLGSAALEVLRLELKISGASSNATKEIGQYFVAGFEGGIKLEQEKVIVVIDKFAVAMLKAFTDAFKIKGDVASATKDIGQTFVSSIGVGIDSESGAVLKDVSKLAGDLTTSLKSGIESGANGPVEAFKNMLNQMLTHLQSFSTNVVNGMSSTMSSVASTLNSTSSASGAVTYSAAPIPNIPMLAGGGAVSSGQLFLANENRKPELIGSFGDQTAVMNSDQIVTAVAQGVAEAVSSVIDNNDGDGDIVIQIGDEVIARAAHRGARKTGFSNFQSTVYDLG